MEFFKAKLPPESFDIKAIAERMQCTLLVAEELVEFNKNKRVVMNDDYQVNIMEIPAKPHWPSMIHLSIKRLDKEPIHDWRVLQDIKNSVLGPEYEAVELYPAESRLTDTANQYHLFALADPDLSFPFGFFDGRNVTDEASAEMVGAKQRAFK